MNGDSSVIASDLGKVYRIDREITGNTFRDEMASRVRKLRTKSAGGRRKDFWALRNVDFTLPVGSITGIIGSNGSGKSTLLKILSRITEPSEGSVELWGRVAALLEVGTGFHPELSGRENIYLNGAVLGMRKREIDRKFDEIVAFAEVPEFLDTPVKRYSSGMYVRLAFAVAAHLEPDILLVDEVLAVGDAAFQRKCLGRMRSIGEGGRTVVIVSHNMAVISQLCNSVVWLEKGRVAGQGEASSVISGYLRSGGSDRSSWTPGELGLFPGLKLFKVQVVANGSTDAAFAADVDLKVVFDYEITESPSPGRFSILVQNEDGTPVLSSSDTDAMSALNRAIQRGRQRSVCKIPGNLLRPGPYFVTVAVPGPDAPIVFEAVIQFIVTEQNSLVARDGRTSLITPLLQWDTRVVDA